MTDKEYDPTQDPGVRQLQQAKSAGVEEEHLRSLEAKLIEQTDNTRKESDPPEVDAKAPADGPQAAQEGPEVPDTDVEHREGS